MKSRVAVVCASPLLAIFAFNCSVPDFCEGAQCGDADGGSVQDSSSDGPPADGSKLSDGAMGDGASTCDLTADPKDSPACVVSADGIFVDSAGSDSNAGTLTAPVKSITKGIALAQGGKARVYVCAGSYSEPVVITSTVSIYGGFACGTYAYTGTLPVVTAPVGSSALTVSGASGVTIEDMQWVSLDANGNDGAGNGNSSVAAFISGAAGVTIERSTFVAGSGAPALPGASTGSFYASPAQQGNAGTATAGGKGFSVTCANGSGETGAGDGADPSKNGSIAGNGSSNPAISPAYPDDGAHGGTGGTNCGSLPALAGSFGTGGAGGLASTSPGSLSSTSWMPSTGGAGRTGGVGEGGGGGASTDPTGGGSSGGAGGCGGNGGNGGAGGGASLGIAIYQSAVSVSALTVRVSVGGTGGSGSKGSTGQNVALAAMPGSSSACSGAIGGFGGSGGGGAGGNGGASLGIVWSGTAPSVEGTITTNAVSLAGITLPSTPAPSGGAGSGGDAVVSAARGGSNGAAGESGVAQAVLGL